MINGYDVAGILRYLHDSCYSTRDYTASRGCIWVVTLRSEHCDSSVFDGLQRRFGARFVYRPEGGKNVNANSGPAWWFNPMSHSGQSLEPRGSGIPHKFPKPPLDDTSLGRHLKRRRQAFELYQKFQRLRLVADRLGVTHQRVHQMLLQGSQAGEFSYRRPTRDERLKRPCFTCGKTRGHSDETCCSSCLSDWQREIMLVQVGLQSLPDVLNMMNLTWRDSRPMGGAFWVKGGRGLGGILTMFEPLGYHFVFKERGARAFKGKPAWFSAKAA
jgi:hypothetical protein